MCESAPAVTEALDPSRVCAIKTHTQRYAFQLRASKKLLMRPVDNEGGVMRRQIRSCGRPSSNPAVNQVDRREAILKYTTKEQRGIEIGPWYNPIASKRDGYRCLVFDVFDSKTLRKRAIDDPNIPASSIPLIEDVDLVGSSTRIGELIRARGEAGTFDYVV
jgi:hypothetical protein